MKDFYDNMNTERRLPKVTKYKNTEDIYNNLDMEMLTKASKCENMLNSIMFVCERQFDIIDSAKARLFQVNGATLIQLGYDIQKYGYNEDDVLYLDEESYKNLMYSQVFYKSKINNAIDKQDISNVIDKQDISNVHKHR